MNLINWLKKLSKLGIKSEISSLEQVSTILSNIISLTLVFLSLTLLLVLPSDFELINLYTALISLGTFSLILYLNHLGLYNCNRLLLSWLPPILVTIRTFYVITQAQAEVPAASYSGLKFYIIASSCIPFVIIGYRQYFKLFIAALPALLILVFTDEIFEWTNLSISEQRLQYPLYDFNDKSAYIAYSFIIGVCLLFNYLVVHSESISKNLIHELDQQKKQISKQADKQLSEANKKLELKLEEIEKREFMLNLSQKIAKVGSWEINRELQFTFWSEEMYNIFEVQNDNRSESITLSKLFGPEKLKKLMTASRELIKRNGEFELTFDIHVSDNNKKWIKIYGTAIIQNEKINGLRGICHDVSTAKEAELIIRSTAKNYKNLFEQSFYSILIINNQGLILNANRSFEELIRSEDQTYLFKNLKSYFYFEGDEIVDFSKNLPNTIGILKNNLGDKLITEINWKQVGSDRNMVTIRDVTKIKEAVDALKESEAKLKELVENAAEALVIFNYDENRFVNASKSAEMLFKMPLYELLKSNFNDISPEFQENGVSSQSQIMEYIDLTIEQGKSSFTWTCEDADNNKIPTEIRLIKNPSEKNTQIRGSIIDISDKIEKNKKLEEARKKIGELKLMALRSVMSPHFIFNVLNSIQYYIGKNDKLNAINYLSTFSKLIRMVLNHSVNDNITLSDEIDLLHKYINLEMLRFDNIFEYEINHEPELEIDYIQMPSLLIQPYVENAILHGLYNKTGNGKLTINIYENEEILYFEIEDNGVGREAAKKLNQGKTHKSMGLNLTAERLRLINERKNIALYTEDLEENGKPSGTRITIGISL